MAPPTWPCPDCGTPCSLDHRCVACASARRWKLNPTPPWKGRRLRTLDGVCAHGHDLAQVGRIVASTGYVHCRTCEAQAKQRWRQRRAGESP